MPNIEEQDNFPGILQEECKANLMQERIARKRPKFISRKEEDPFFQVTVEEDYNPLEDKKKEEIMKEELE